MGNEHFQPRDWDDFKDGSRVCLECHYRWPIQDVINLTGESACPNCGFSNRDVFEAQSPTWNGEDNLATARLVVEVYSYRMPGGFRMGWLKDEVDKLLATLIAGGVDTSARLSGAPANEYKWTPQTDELFTYSRVDGAETGPDPAPGPSLKGSILDFLDKISGRRATMARRVYIPWDEDDHRN